jgi:hypothetical protein
LKIYRLQIKSTLEKKLSVRCCIEKKVKHAVTVKNDNIKVLPQNFILVFKIMLARKITKELRGMFQIQGLAQVSFGKRVAPHSKD